MDYLFFLERMHRAIMPSTGCTEPVAIALNTATARASAKGAVKKLTITLDNYLYKNAMGVGIPGADERGVALCAAMGVTAGDAKAQMRVLDHVSGEALQAAKQMLFDGLVTVNTREDVHGLLVESVLETTEDTVRVLTLAIVTPSFVISGAPKLLSKTTFLPLGPSVTLTVSANLFTPSNKDFLASSPNLITFAI